MRKKPQRKAKAQANKEGSKVQTEILASVIVLTTILAKVIEKLVDKIVNKKNSNGSYNMNGITAKIDEMHSCINNISDVQTKVNRTVEILSKTDSDGIPFCYTPRQLIKLQERILEKQDVIISLLSNIARKD